MKMNETFRDDCGGELRNLGLGPAVLSTQVGQDLELWRGAAVDSFLGVTEYTRLPFSLLYTLHVYTKHHQEVRDTAFTLDLMPRLDLINRL